MVKDVLRMFWRLELVASCSMVKLQSPSRGQSLYLYFCKYAIVHLCLVILLFHYTLNCSKRVTHFPHWMQLSPDIRQPRRQKSILVPRTTFQGSNSRPPKKALSTKTGTLNLPAATLEVCVTEMVCSVGWKHEGIWQAEYLFTKPFEGAQPATVPKPCPSFHKRGIRFLPFLTLF